ncbi:hypothetical protein F2Q69_00031122 [Brassica cretica]|uniref:Uncharacterized protein n=1 Tax=Brassica cretica TaxID=69181 RepID=A0A8S9SAT5_BRACR|nr:hypothetical protein F2Q69_00031122 [Brassica cretica]
MPEDALPFTVAPAVGGVGGRSFFRLFLIPMRTQLRPDRVSSVCRRNNVIPTTYRRNKSSEITPRKFIFPRKSLGNFRRNSEETPRTTSSSERSSEYTEGELPRDISMDFLMVQSSEVPTKCSSEFSSGISEERSPGKIPRKESLGIFRRLIPRKCSSKISEGSFPRNFKKN